MSLKLQRNDRRGRVQRELLAAARASVGRATDLKVNLERLDGDEQAELVQLTQRIAAGAEKGVVRADPRYLDDRDRRRYEQLVERAADKPGFFEQQRKERVMRQKIADLAVKARRPPARPLWEEQGCVVLSKALHDDLAQELAIWIEDVAVLWYVLTQIETGELLSPRARFEGTGDDTALVIDRHMGLIAGPHNPEGNLGRWKDSLDNLARIDWLAVENRGREIVIRRGPRALAVIRARSAA